MKFLSNVFAGIALLFWGLAIYHWWVGTYANSGDIVTLVIVGVIAYLPAMYFSGKVKTKPKAKVKEEVKEKPEEVAQLNLQDEPKAEKEAAPKTEKAQGVSKVGLFGAAVGTYAASKANAINKAPMVVVTSGHADVIGVRHIRGKKYKVYVVVHETNGISQERNFDVDPHVSGYHSGNATFDIRW